jgi:hypothetical protein
MPAVARRAGMVAARGAVGDDDDVVVARDQPGGLAAEALHRPRHALGALLDGPGGVEDVRREHVVIDLLELLDLEVPKQGLADDELVGVLG